MIKIGLTGSIGMGKSTTARMFQEEGVPVWDADAAVHRMYAPGGAAVAPVSERFPGSQDQLGGIDRQRLSQMTLDQPDVLRELEGIVHPLVRADQQHFIYDAAMEGAAMVLLDIPLLVEGNMADLFDEIVVVTADEEIRRQRVLDRADMSPEKLASILKRQAPEAERLAKATYVIRTDEGIPAAKKRVREVLAAIREKHGLPI